MKKILFFFAAAGWAVSLVTNILTWFDVDVQHYVPYISLLHVGIFVVWVPAILGLKKKQQADGVVGKQGSSLKSAMAATPKWMSTIAMAGFVYAFINFGIFMLSEQGEAAIRNGHFVLETHGHFVRDLTEKEYRHLLPNDTRGFSGHWVLFYGFAAAVLYPFAKEKNSENI